jgi:hypothetical protein
MQRNLLSLLGRIPRNLRQFVVFRFQIGREKTSRSTLAGAHLPSFLCWLDGRSGFPHLIWRIECDQKPSICASPLDPFGSLWIGTKNGRGITGCPWRDLRPISRSSVNFRLPVIPPQWATARSADRDPHDHGGRCSPLTVELFHQLAFFILSCNFPNDSDALMRSWRRAVIAILRAAAQAGQLVTRIASLQLEELLTQLVEHPRSVFPRQRAFPQVRGTLHQAASHRGASHYVDYRPNRDVLVQGEKIAPQD